jgi:hypothetical protein
MMHRLRLTTGVGAEARVKPLYWMELPDLAIPFGDGIFIFHLRETSLLSGAEARKCA